MFVGEYSRALAGEPESSVTVVIGDKKQVTQRELEKTAPGAEPAGLGVISMRRTFWADLLVVGIRR